MAAPREIVGLLESVLGVFFSEVRHRERASFLLCDALVENACKRRALEDHHNFDLTCNFITAVTAPGVELDPQADLGQRLMSSRQLRNHIAHGIPGVTVDSDDCADAILDAIDLIVHCWPDSHLELPAAIRAGIRIVRLYSSTGPRELRQPFEDRMRDAEWSFEDRKARANEVIVRPGLRHGWNSALVYYLETVESCLNEVGAP